MRTTRSDLRAMMAREKRDLAELLRTLTPEQWQTESLCAGWQVRDVVAHLLYEATPPARYAGELIRAAGSVDRHNDGYITRGRTMTTAELLAAYETTIETGIAARWAPRIGLADTMIHHQDIRRPLGATRQIPEPHLLTLLNHPDPTLHPRSRMRGLHFQATDVDWQQGSGPLVQGAGEAIFMAVAGRTIALDELTGGGVDILRGRLR